jgi:hypothetical protein
VGGGGHFLQEKNKKGGEYVKMNEYLTAGEDEIDCYRDKVGKICERKRNENVKVLKLRRGLKLPCLHFFRVFNKATHLFCF